VDLNARVLRLFEESQHTAAAAAQSVASPIAAAATRMAQALINDRKILACGNGGSAADAQHFSCELLNRFQAERPGLPALALTADSSTLTAIANDYSYDEVFAKQVRALGQSGDILLAITTSGNSASVLKAVDAAHERGMPCIALTDRAGGDIAGMLRTDDVLLCAAGPSTPRIQEVHIIVIHCLCDLIDQQLLGQG